MSGQPPSQNYPFPPEQPQQPPPQVVYVVQQPQYRPEDYVRAYRRDEGNRMACGCLVFFVLVVALTILLMNWPG